MVLKRKIAFIDLSKNSVEIAPVPVDVTEKFLGGRGIDMYFLSRNLRVRLRSFFSKKPAHLWSRSNKDDLDTSLNTPILCRQCKEMKCLDDRRGAEARQRKKFLWKKARAEHCPFRALSVLGGKAFHCKLCGGKPQCVNVCILGPIRIIEWLLSFLKECDHEKRNYFERRRLRE